MKKELLVLLSKNQKKKTKEIVTPLPSPATTTTKTAAPPKSFKPATAKSRMNARENTEKVNVIKKPKLL